MVRVSTLSVTLSGVLAGAILILALFPPAVKESARASTGVSPAQRVAILTIILSSYATINEGADHIVAMSKQALEWGRGGRFSCAYPALGRIPVSVKSEIPDPEQVLYLRPDAVFVWAGQGEILKKVRQPGLVEIAINPKSPIQSRERIWRQMGAVTGKNARVTELLGKWAAKRAALKIQLPLGTGRQIRVAYVHINDGEWWTTNSNYYIAYRLQLAGAENAGKDLRFNSKADLEQLLLLDPDVILFGTNPKDHTTMRQIAGPPQFQSLRAVREGRVYKLPEHTYMNEPVEDLFVLTWLAEIFYPDAMPRRLRAEYKETYWGVYHYGVSDDEIDKAINLEENRRSAGYDRFVRQVGDL